MQPSRAFAPPIALVALGLIVAACGGSTASAPASGPAATATHATPGPTPAATPAATAAYAPAPRTSAAMTWDPTSQAILMFGGDNNVGPSDAFDAWDGTRWQKLGQIGPPSRDDGLLVADPERRVVVLAGGRHNQDIRTDTWEWDGSAWTKKADGGLPPRAHAAAAWDPISKRMLVYGGVNDDGTMRDTWAWDGTLWTQLDDVGIPGLIPNGMAWDPVLERLLVLAVDIDAESTDHTYPSELWGWTGDGWERVAAGAPSFSPLQQFVQGPRHPWLLDGGVVQGAFATWEWTGEGADWTAISGTAPPLRNGQAVAFDPVRHQMVLYGGFVDGTVFGDTWVLDDGAWRKAGPAG
jgi:hypothetical protein